MTGRISVARKIDKDIIAGAAGACPKCGRAISGPKTASGLHTVHVPRPFLPMLQKHLLDRTAAGPSGLLFLGDRTDRMGVRYLMDRYRPARAGHASQAAMAIYQHATLDRDKSLAEKIGVIYQGRQTGHRG